MGRSCVWQAVVTTDGCARCWPPSAILGCLGALIGHVHAAVGRAARRSITRGLSPQTPSSASQSAAADCLWALTAPQIVQTLSAAGPILAAHDQQLCRAPAAAMLNCRLCCRPTLLQKEQEPRCPPDQPRHQDRGIWPAVGVLLWLAVRAQAQSCVDQEP